MMRYIRGGVIVTIRWMAEMAGFGTLDEAVTRRALRRLVYLSGGAWTLSLLAMFNSEISPLAGVAVLSLVAAMLAGGILIFAQTNFELASMVAGNMAQQQAVPTAQAQVPPASRAAPAPLAHAPPAMHLPPQVPAAAPPRALMGPRQPETHQVLSRGYMEGRAYSVYSDGSIELETSFGPRWFATIDLAHEFIGLRNGASLRLVAPEMARVA